MNFNSIKFRLRIEAREKAIKDPRYKEFDQKIKELREEQQKVFEQLEEEYYHELFGS